ncbi:HET-domain-containing protein [Lentithecium fluviatile CBS 122367]|uniref:HET-domain-containing protein n=1 Tax=Lentithecium fluviatile CBS 122367 TaxID=1168545 RepID=A0A6G1JNF8_9PLEO|nr:HET-domain-containing protein [Lentithecium fluviatile CBS 122367]
MRELKSSSDLRCPLCRAILSTPIHYEKDTLLADDDEPLGIVLDIDPSKGPRPVLSVTFYAVANAQRVARIPRRMVAACESLLEDDDLASTLERCSQLENNNTGSDATFELASYWLHRCLSEHKQCRMSSDENELPFMPTRLLDVSNNAIRLIETKDLIGTDLNDRVYLSLSHCWGLVPIIRTLQENYEAHLTNIDPAKLSKTFREAVHVTRKLRFRYIWIDSLCIIQDSASDWAAEAATMCDVYRNATLKIAAAHAGSGDVGCFKDRDGLLQFPFVAELALPATRDASSTKPRHILLTSYGRIEGVGAPEPPLYGRAWVLQEQLLSPRMLIFDGNLIRWECVCGHGNERTPTGGMSRHIGLQKDIRAGIFSTTDFFDMLDDNPGKVSGARIKLLHWCDAVMDYTHRGMTKASDRLVALDGIAQALRMKTKRKYYAGLWSQDLWMGLLWSISHEDEYTPTTMASFDLERNKHVRHDEDLAPSWSWASVTVPVVYLVPTIIYLDHVCEILSTHVSGTPAKQSGRLEMRGHIRTGYVDAIYPYAIQEAAAVAPNRTCKRPTATKNSNTMSYRGRSFHPADYFIFSETNPSSTFSRLSSNWRFVRGTFRPDEIIAPNTQLSFIAIAQQHNAHKPDKFVNSHDSIDPLQVWSLALLPTGRAEGEYRRVGYAMWEDCTWYGYMCGHGTRLGRTMEKAGDWRGLFSMGDLETLGWSRPVDGQGVHEHMYESGALPKMDRYHKDVAVEEKVIVIV